MIYTIVDLTATLLEYLMLYLLLDGRRQPVQAVLSGFLYLIFVRILTIWGFPPDAKLILLLGLDLLIGYAFFGHRPIKSFSLGLLHFTAICLGEIIVQCILMFLYSPSLKSLPLPLWITAILLSKLLSILACQVFCKLFSGLTFQGRTRLHSFVLLPLGSILLLMSRLEGHILGYEINSWNKELPIFTAGLLASVICLLYIYHYYFRLKEAQTAQKLSERQMLTVFDFYENRKKMEETNRKMYHDIQAHMNTLLRMAPSDSRQEYAKEIIEQLSNIEFPPSSGNDTLDVIVKEAHEQCEKLGVRLLFIGNFNTTQFMRPFDQVTVFHNAIQNALDEYERHVHPEKVIEVQTWMFRNFLNIRVMNFYSPPEKDHVKDPSIHGYGLKNIKDAIARYGGKTVTEIKDGKFYLRIIIPLKEDKQPLVKVN